MGVSVRALTCGSPRCLSPMDATNFYESIGFGDIHGIKSYEFIGFGDIHGIKSYEFIGFGDIHGAQPYEFIGPRLPAAFATEGQGRS